MDISLNTHLYPVIKNLSAILGPQMINKQQMENIRTVTKLNLSIQTVIQTFHPLPPPSKAGLATPDPRLQISSAKGVRPPGTLIMTTYLRPDLPRQCRRPMCCPPGPSPTTTSSLCCPPWSRGGRAGGGRSRRRWSSKLKLTRGPPPCRLGLDGQLHHQPGVRWTSSPAVLLVDPTGSRTGLALPPALLQPPPSRATGPYISYISH